MITVDVELQPLQQRLLIVLYAHSIDWEFPDHWIEEFVDASLEEIQAAMDGLELLGIVRLRDEELLDEIMGTANDA